MVREVEQVACRRLPFFYFYWIWPWFVITSSWKDSVTADKTSFVAENQSIQITMSLKSKSSTDFHLPLAILGGILNPRQPPVRQPRQSCFTSAAKRVHFRSTEEELLSYLQINKSSAMPITSGQSLDRTLHLRRCLWYETTSDIEIPSNCGNNKEVGG